MPKLARSAARPAVTHPDKILYPATGTTKAMVAAYYEQIAPLMLPHLRGRALSLKRVPNGVAGIAFFEKRAPANLPPWVGTVTVASTTHGSLTYVTAENAETLMWLANRAALELHPFLFRLPDETHPTTIVFDLDPGPPAGLRECLGLAIELRDLLTDLGLQSFVKSSGGKGLHVLVPITGATFAQTKRFAQAVAEVCRTRHPDTIVTRMTRALRPGRILIDWSQNDHGKTTVAAYSLRVRERPMVSAPLTWDELVRARRRGQHDSLLIDLPTMLKRAKTTGDLLAASLTLRQQLPPIARTLI